MGLTSERDRERDRERESVRERERERAQEAKDEKKKEKKKLKKVLKRISAGEGLGTWGSSTAGSNISDTSTTPVVAVAIPLELNITPAEVGTGDTPQSRTDSELTDTFFSTIGSPPGPTNSLVGGGNAVNNGTPSGVFSRMSIVEPQEHEQEQEQSG